jgi:molybdopterin-guanine dinucleotide biosynthesis adapter protein
LRTLSEANGHGKPIIFQIAGYSNSGKTAFITKLINLLKAEWKVATLKHHGHGGKPEVTDEKDSHQHISAGAIASIVEGGGRILLQAEGLSWTLQEQIQLLSFFNTDLILIEGYKQEDFPKVVLLRKQEECELLQKLSNVMAVYYWDKEILKNKQTNLPCFHIDDEQGLTWLKDHLNKRVLAKN